MSAVLAPDRTHLQRLDALEKANYVRTYRRVLKEDLKHGRQSVVDVLLAPPDEVRSMPLAELLMACPRWGDTKVGKTLRRAELPPRKKVGNLTERQTRVLLRAIGGVSPMMSARCQPVDGGVVLGGQHDPESSGGTDVST